MQTQKRKEVFDKKKIVPFLRIFCLISNLDFCLPNEIKALIMRVSFDFFVDRFFDDILFYQDWGSMRPVTFHRVCDYNNGEYHDKINGLEYDERCIRSSYRTNLREIAFLCIECKRKGECKVVHGHGQCKSCNHLFLLNNCLGEWHPCEDIDFKYYGTLEAVPINHI